MRRELRLQLPYKRRRTRIIAKFDKISTCAEQGIETAEPAYQCRIVPFCHVFRVSYWRMEKHCVRRIVFAAWLTNIPQRWRPINNAVHRTADELQLRISAE